MSKVNTKRDDGPYEKEPKMFSYRREKSPCPMLQKIGDKFIQEGII